MGFKTSHTNQQRRETFMSVLKGKTRSKVSWSVEDWFNIDKEYFTKTSTSLVFGLGVNNMDVQIKPIDSISNPIYTKWQRLLERCHCPKYQNRFPSYKNVSMCDRWLLFSNFREDYLKMVNRNINRRCFVLDKDLLIKGNKIYSPETCCLLPQHINNFLTDCKSHRGSLPRGVSKRSKGYKYMVTLSYDGLNKNLGDYNTPEEAFEVYKKAKESLAQKLSVSEPNLQQVERDALMNYKVLITD